MRGTVIVVFMLIMKGSTQIKGKESIVVKIMKKIGNQEIDKFLNDICIWHLMYMSSMAFYKSMNLIAFLLGGIFCNHPRL